MSFFEQTLIRQITNLENVAPREGLRTDPKLVGRDVNGPAVDLNVRGAFLVLLTPASLSITSPLTASLTMPARTVFAEVRHFLGVGLKVESSCHRNPL